MTAGHGAGGTRTDVLHAAGLLVLMLVHALPYAGAAVFSDTARDLDAAWDIVEGARPLVGPLINDALHLGPAWFYLLAVPLSLSKSLAITLLVAGTLAALKFPLAYVLGRQLVDARFGLLWAAALALPGWSSMGQIQAMHVVLVEATTLVTLYALLRLSRQSHPRWWVAYGGLQSLALHAHPATLLLGMLVPAVLWRRRGTVARREAAWLVLGLMAAALPFLPMLVHEASSGWMSLEKLQAYGASHALLPALLDAPALLRGVVNAGPLLLWDGLGGGMTAAFMVALNVTLVALATAGLIGMARTPHGRERLLALVLITALMLLGLAMLRERTPWYMAVHDRLAMTAYRCDDCVGAQVEWELQIENSRSDWLDIFLLDPVSVSQSRR